MKIEFDTEDYLPEESIGLFVKALLKCHSVDSLKRRFKIIMKCVMDNAYEEGYCSMDIVNKLTDKEN